LLAVGLVVVYRGTRIINFAYGETGMIGAFVFSELWTTGHLALGLALVAGVATSAAVGALTEVVLVRPLRGQPPLTAMVGTLAVAECVIGYLSPVTGIVEVLVAGFVIVLLLVRPSELVRSAY